MPFALISALTALLVLTSQLLFVFRFDCCPIPCQGKCSEKDGESDEIRTEYGCCYSHSSQVEDHYDEKASCKCSKNGCATPMLCSKSSSFDEVGAFEVRETKVSSRDGYQDCVSVEEVSLPVSIQTHG